MAKRKIKRNDIGLITYYPHYYSWGGDLIESLGVNDIDIKDIFSGDNVGNILKGGLSSFGSTIGNTAGNIISGGLNSGVGNAIGKVGSVAGNMIGSVNPLLGGIVSAGTGIIGGVTNALFGSKLNKENIANIENSNNKIGNTVVSGGDFNNIISQWNNQDFGKSFSQSDIGKDGLFSNKAKNKYKELKREQNEARNKALTSYSNITDNVDYNNDLTALANYSAYGGPLYMDNIYNNVFGTGGSIHIKPENRGKFTALKERTGKSATWFKEHGTPAQKKMAVFALNAKKWKHSDGGPLFTNGGVFSNGIININNGGTHEENPNEGIQMGIDNQGIPNLVEEGEVVYDDYVFSNRIKVPDNTKRNLNIKSKDITFAKAAKQLQKESEERPNDPISKRGLEYAMKKLAFEQESTKGNMNKYSNKYAEGGKIKFTPSTYNNDKNLNDIYPETYDPLKDWTLESARKDISQGYELSDDNIGYKAMGITNSKRRNTQDNSLTWLRYAPVLGSAIGLGYDIFSKPDYSNAEKILEASEDVGNYTPIEYTPIGNYLQYKPFDRNYYLNKINSLANSSRRAIMNSSSPSRNAAILASDYNTIGKIGDLARQAEEYNLAQRQAVENFNRGTNMSNAEMGLKAAMANQEASLKSKSSKLSGIIQAMAMRDAIDSRRSASMSANMTNLFDSLGNIGIDAYNRADRDMLIDSGIYGMLSQKPQDWSNEKWEDFKSDSSKRGYSKGGKLKRKRKGDII